MDFAFPPELSDALRRLYHLRRGPFLSPGPLQSFDDRTEIRSLFIRFPLEDCLMMMAPSLWGCGDLQAAAANLAPSFEEIPPETLSLWDEVSCWNISNSGNSLIPSLFSVSSLRITGTVFLFGQVHRHQTGNTIACASRCRSFYLIAFQHVSPCRTFIFSLKVIQ
jgi:hypothetical protein